MESWRRFQKEHDKNILAETEFNNIGELIAAMQAAVGEKEMEQLRAGAIEQGVDHVVGLVPFGSIARTVATKLFEKVRKAINDGGEVPTDLKNNPVLLALFVEPDVSAVVANNIELQMVDKLESEIQEMVDMLSADPDADPFSMKLPEMNMTKFLTKFISDEYDGTILKPKDGGTS